MHGAVAETTGGLGRMVTLEMLYPSPLNPRKRFTPASLVDLAENVKKRQEVIVPLILRTNKRNGKFEIIDGERRYRAAQSAGNIEAVPAIFRDDLTDGEVIEIQLLSAIQRQELTPLEEAGGYAALIESNKAKYSAAYIADRIGRSEKYVVDRMRLTHLIPILKKLLEAERILVGHAELLCKLKPEDQERAVLWDGQNLAYRKLEGLWESEADRLKLDDEDDEEPTPKNLYRGLKPVTVKELESWIAHHVRFDVEHAAATAPLDFAPVKQQVDEALEQPGRGKKVIAITHEYRVADDARDPAERTYGSNSWERADGKEKSKTCEHSVLGTVVAGRGYGSTLQVCIARDKCKVHFGDVIRQREKNQKLRQQGKGGKANQNEAAANAKRQEKEAQQEREREARRKLWNAIAEPLYVEARRQAKAIKKISPAIAKQILDCDSLRADDAKNQLGAKWFEQPATALIVMALDETIEMSEYDVDTFEEFINGIAKPFDLDLKPFEEIRDKHAPKVDAAAPAKTAKKAKKR